MSDHIPDLTKMIGETPRTDAARPPYTELQEFVSAEFARTLERELNVANERIKRLEAVTNDPHALWANWLRGSVALPVGIGDVRQYQDRIKRLEEAGDELLTAMRDDWSEYVDWIDETTDAIGKWNKAKEAKP